ncbi:hypothetical protein NQ318_009235 [Aromia moschata]|uniref:Uncharacterized protein n=1 Tax=Aromia moschata TaxID=1265417 RepID=A0AAV8YCL3_9CUCU|nr:hypothetical protein NQ318_009235 [Aromia moschata]
MFSVQMEQRVNLKFLVKLGKTLTETYAMLKEMYGNDNVYPDVLNDGQDDPRPGRPSTSKTDGNIGKRGKLIREDRRLSIQGLAEITEIDKECVRQLLHESFNMRKVCAKMMPKLLTPEQNKSRMNICADTLNNIDTDPSSLDTMITCDDKFKVWKFESVEVVKAKPTEVLDQLTKADFQHCFQQ